MMSGAEPYQHVCMASWLYHELVICSTFSSPITCGSPLSYIRMSLTSPSTSTSASRPSTGPLPARSFKVKFACCI